MLGLYFFVSVNMAPKSAVSSRVRLSPYATVAEIGAANRSSAGRPQKVTMPVVLYTSDESYYCYYYYYYYHTTTATATTTAAAAAAVTTTTLIYSKHTIGDEKVATRLAAVREHKCLEYYCPSDLWSYTGTCRAELHSNSKSSAGA